MADGDHSGVGGLDGVVNGGGDGGTTAAPSATQSRRTSEIKAPDEGEPNRPSSLRASPSNARGPGSSHVTTLLRALTLPDPARR